MELSRTKPRHWGLSLAYRLSRWLPMSRARKLDLLLDAAWIATRLAHENSVSLQLHRQERNDFLLDRIAPSDSVLELGCGTGEVIGSVSARRRLGIDYDAAKIAVARERFPDVEFRVADLKERLHEQFDVLILSHVLEHLDDPEGVLRIADFRRIYVELPDFGADPLNAVRLRRNRSLVYSDADHVRELRREEAEALFARAGLTVSKSEFRLGVMRYWLMRPPPSPPRS